MTGNFGSTFITKSFVAEDDSAKLDFIFDAAAAMIGEARIVVSDDPGPVEIGCKVQEKVAGVLSEALAPKSIVKAVTETVEPRRTGPFYLRCQTA